jgi:demethylmenaquinone methyltransferase/2-methoxy-6-polyprenyl-1,4-benzoquinol methylase
MPVDDGEDELVAEQRAFYQARAPEYDEWWQGRGRYDRGDEVAAAWDHQVTQIERALEFFDARGDVLELAGGTGWWTERLARTAERLTVVDASSEALEINRQRLGRDDVEYLVADLLSWMPSKAFDVVFFSFWLSHVPRSRFSWFWDLVASCLGPSGRVFFIDNRNDPIRTTYAKDPYVVEYGPDRHLRRLSDGREYRVVKVMYEPDQLQSELERHGWAGQVEGTRWFVFGNARPNPSDKSTWESRSVGGCRPTGRESLGRSPAPAWPSSLLLLRQGGPVRASAGPGTLDPVEVSAKRLVAG